MLIWNPKILAVSLPSWMRFLTRDVGVQTDSIGQGFTGIIRLEDLQMFLDNDVPIYNTAPEKFYQSAPLQLALPEQGKTLFEVDRSGRPLIQLDHDLIQDLMAYTQSTLGLYAQDGRMAD